MAVCPAYIYAILTASLLLFRFENIGETTSYVRIL